MIGHPSVARLSNWLDGDDLPGVDSHLETCERCAAELNGIGVSSSGGSIAASLSVVLAAPEGLPARIETRVIAKLDSRQVFEYLADLFGAGLETTRILLLDDPPDK